MKMSLEQELAKVLNCHCAENGSNTPDLILAEYLIACLAAFNVASMKREHWYGHHHGVAGQTWSPEDDHKRRLPAHRDFADASPAPVTAPPSHFDQA